jgi:hypothetical protein
MFETFIHPALDALMLAIGTGIVGVLVQLFKKLKLTLSAQAEAKVAYYVQQAIAYAEEKIEALLKKGVIKAEDTAKLKMAEAINYLLSKVPGLNSLKAKEDIIAGLGSSPFGASTPVV